MGCPRPAAAAQARAATLSLAQQSPRRSEAAKKSDRVSALAELFGGIGTSGVTRVAMSWLDINVALGAMSHFFYVVSG